jgi:hypothetical protein
VLSWGNKKRSINQGVPFEDHHHAVAEDAGDPVHLMCCIVGEDETPSFVIPDTALVFHLDVIRVDLLPRKNIECAIIISSQKNATTTVMS